MATLSENQVRHLYVVKAAADFSATKENDGTLFFNVKDVDGNQVRSDLLTNIVYAKATSALQMQRKLKAIKITANDADMVAGQAYVVKIKYRGFISGSDEDTYYEMGSALCTTTGDDVEVVLAKLAKNLYVNTLKQGMVEIKAIVSNAEKDPSTLANNDVVTGIVIREKVQKWHLGLLDEVPVDFTVSTSPILKSSMDYQWATFTDITASSTVIGNGKKIAEMEYFLMGERGDIYRMKGWPNVIPTKYMVDETKQYDAIDIHYYYSNETGQKSEKDILLVIPAGTPASPDHSVAIDILTAINATGAVTLVKPSDWTTPDPEDSQSPESPVEQ